MSGIVGIVSLDGAPVDRALLERMTARLAFRGPDAQQAWCDGRAGLGHALLATTDDGPPDRQPLAGLGDTWITADARVDARPDLVRALAAAGRGRREATSDAGLILEAYQTWGDACVDHLLGDFAFAIWDRPRRRLFCARDHFGVKPFFYARCGGAFVFSNTLTCVRLHPAVSDALDDRTIADFLLFKANLEFDTTAFADIRRLPGGHTLTVDAAETAPPVIRRYWRLSQPAGLRYRRKQEYVDHFRDILETAVRDRLRTPRVAIAMSGGLDSSAVAAVAKQIASSHLSPVDLRAFTTVYDRVIPDEERKYASVVAQSLDIPIEFLVADDVAPFRPSDATDLWLPEPADVRYAAHAAEESAAIAERYRVMLTGVDADSLLRETPATHFAALRREGRWRDLLAALARYLTEFHTVPPIGIRTVLRRLAGRPPRRTARPPFPAWIDPDLSARLRLRERWGQVCDDVESPPPALRRGVANLATPTWRNLLEVYDPGISGSALEYRHPFADLRVVTSLLAVPAVPWCIDKTILREALRGVIPESVRLRPKSFLAGDPVSAWLSRPESGWVDTLQPSPRLRRYVDATKVSPATGAAALAPGNYANLIPRSLNCWLTCGYPMNNGIPTATDARAVDAAWSPQPS